MTTIVLINIVFFIPATCGATAFAVFIYRFLQGAFPPDARPPHGGSKAPRPTAGPEDLARSA
jgi:hypothetical protein